MIRRFRDAENTDQWSYDTTGGSLLYHEGTDLDGIPSAMTLREIEDYIRKGEIVEIYAIPEHMRLDEGL